MAASAVLSYLGAISPFAFQRGATLIVLVRLALLLPKVASYALAARGFLGHPDLRYKRWRLAAWMWLGANAAPLLLMVVEYVLARPLSSHIDYDFILAASVVYFLFDMAFALVVARAFAPRTATSRRNRLLAWALLVYEVGGVTSWVIGSRAYEWWPDSLLNDSIRQILVLGAAIAATVGFLRVASSASPPTPERIARRERALAIAAIFLVLNYAGSTVGGAYSVHRMSQLYWAELALGQWLTLASIVTTLVAAVLAVVAFVVSRRSLLLCARAVHRSATQSE